MTIQIVEHEIYKAILTLTEYEQVFPNTMVQTINRVAFNANRVLSEDDKIHIKGLVNNIENGIQQFFIANPQFKRISKGVVIDMFAYYSKHFKSQYKSVYIERQVSYTAQLYLERLIGYFSWLKFKAYGFDEVQDKIHRYNIREKKHVFVEQNQELNDTLNCIYTEYMQSFRECPLLSQTAILGILYKIHSKYFK